VTRRLIGCWEAEGQDVFHQGAMGAWEMSKCAAGVVDIWRETRLSSLEKVFVVVQGR
jgi:hypothetical protein